MVLISNTLSTKPIFPDPVLDQAFENSRKHFMAHQMLSNMAEISGQFSKQKLIDSLKKYRTDHQYEYKDALDVYRLDIAEKLRSLATEYTNKKDTLTGFNVAHNLGLTAPINCDEEYKKLIYLFEMMTIDEIKLSFAEANRILNNDWQWIEAASSTNAFYASRKAG